MVDAVPGEITILAEFRIGRLLALLLVLVAILAYSIISPYWLVSGTVLNYSDHSPMLRSILVLIAASAALVAFVLLLRVLFTNKIAIYLHNRQVCWAWALGTMRLPLEQVASFSQLIPGSIIVEKKGGGRTYITSAVTQMPTALLLARLNEALEADRRANAR